MHSAHWKKSHLTLLKLVKVIKPHDVFTQQIGKVQVFRMQFEHHMWSSSCHTHFIFQTNGPPIRSPYFFPWPPISGFFLLVFHYELLTLLLFMMLQVVFEAAAPVGSTQPSNQTAQQTFPHLVSCMERLSCVFLGVEGIAKATQNLFRKCLLLRGPAVCIFWGRCRLQGTA